MKKRRDQMTDRNQIPMDQQLPDKILREVDESDRELLRKVWKLSGEADTRGTGTTLTPQETEEALQDLHAQLEFESRADKVTGTIRRYGRYLVAALALIAFGTAYFLIPQTINAPFGEMAEVSMSDGSVVELNSGSSLQFNRLFGITNRTVSLNGEAYFDVAPQSEPFEVKANGTTTRVLGTEFSIRSWSDHPGRETKISVIEGEVLFYPDDNHRNAVTLSQSLGSRWAPGIERPEDPSRIVIERATGWRNQKFIFYEEPLQLIFRELERRFDLQITLQNQQAANETLTGYYREVSDPESLLGDICTVAGLNYAKTANGYRVY